MSVESEELARITKERDAFRVKDEKRRLANLESTRRYYADMKKAGLREIKVKIPDTVEAAESTRAHAEALINEIQS